jgi:hypothetical protein
MFLSPFVIVLFPIRINLKIIFAFINIKAFSHEKSRKDHPYYSIVPTGRCWSGARLLMETQLRKTGMKLDLKENWPYS